MEGLSASQIAAELGEGVTRNAVIGKVHRLKLSGRAKPASSAPRHVNPGRQQQAHPGDRVAQHQIQVHAPRAAARRQHQHRAVRLVPDRPLRGGNTALKMSADTEAEQSFELNAESEIFIPGSRSHWTDGIE